MPQFPLLTLSNFQRSRTVDQSRVVNRYLSVVSEGIPKNKLSGYKRPGLRRFTSVSAPIRALYEQDGQAYAVGGPHFYQLGAEGSATLRGSMVYNTNPATISSSGKAGDQLFVTSAGEGYIYVPSTLTFSNITSSTFPDHCVSGLYFKSGFYALSGVDGRVQTSDLLDGFTWNALDFAIESDFSDQIIQIARSIDNLWFFGTQNTAVWWYSGNASQPLQPVQGAILEHGLAAPFSVVAMANTLIWIGRDANGSGQVWKANGYRPEKISNGALDSQLASLPTYAQAVAFPLMMESCLWYVLYVPGLKTTWVYDIATGLWCEWAHKHPDTLQYVPFVGTTHCYFAGKHLIGDRRSGAIYELAFDQYEDELVAL